MDGLTYTTSMIQEIKELLEDVPINQPEIILWLKDYIKEGMWK